MVSQLMLARVAAGTPLATPRWVSEPWWRCSRACWASASGSRALPRDKISIFSALCGFFGLAFVVAGVIAPGGTWMFFEVILLLWLLARRRSRVQTAGPEIALVSVLALQRVPLIEQRSSAGFAGEIYSAIVPVKERPREAEGR